MKKLYILFYIIFVSKFSFSQTYYPLIRPNTTWDVMFINYMFNPICGYYGGGRYFFEGDTIINTINYTIVKSYNVVSDPPYCGPFSIDTSISGIAGFMREDTITQRIYRFDQFNNIDDLLLDFNLNPGDTLSSFFYDGYWPPLIVDSVSSITLLNGEVRKIIYLNNWPQHYIESIGGSQGLLFPVVEGIGFGNIPECVIENGITIWNWGGLANHCMPIVGIEENLIENSIKIYPNPSSGNLNIIYLLPQNKEGKLEMFDITGKIVYEMRLPQWSTLQQFDLPHLPQGIYAVKLSSDGYSAINKLIVQH